MKRSLLVLLCCLAASGSRAEEAPGDGDARYAEGYAAGYADGLLKRDPPPPPRALSAFPPRLIFQPLLADPRWPRFSGSLQHYFRRESNKIWAASFGESFTFFERRDGRRPWQFGLQAAVFTNWDVQTESEDFLNADFLVGFPLSWRRGRWSAMARLFHVSSHLGDEFLLHHPAVERVNLSYEAVDQRFSCDLPGGARLYGGGGYIIRRYPPEIKPGFLQAGAEFTGSAFGGGLFRPVAAVDLQKHQKSGWAGTDVSARAGVQMQNRRQPSRRLLLAVEYYWGHNPNGQFYPGLIEEAGLGLHIYF